MNKFLMTSAAVLALASTAKAEGDFQGFYAGVNAGYATGKMDRISQNPVVVDGKEVLAAGGKISDAFTGFTGGIHAGYNHQIGDVVLGAEFGFNLGNMKTDILKTKRKNEFTAAARVGYVVNSWLPYVKAGWNNAKFSQIEGAETTGSRSNGFLLGAGLETVFSNNILAGAEWTTVKYKGDLRTQEFKVRLGYKF